MAIQDNTDYTLKGKQVKKIVQEIKESGITYSAGTGLELTGTTFSVDNTIATKSEIPTVNNATLTIQKNSTTAGTFTANSATDATINITVPVTAADVSALPASTKYASSLSLTIDSSTYVVTGQLKDQDGNNLGSAQTIDLPLESVVVSGSYDSTNKKIILTLQSGQTIDIPVGDLVSGLQSEITSSNKLSADLVDDSTTTNKFVTATDKTTWSGKQNALTAGSNITISGDTISATDTTYTAGTGLSLNGTEFSVDTSTVQSKLTAGSNITITGDTISATDTTYSDFVGATSGDAGTHGLVPAPASGDTDKYLKSDGSWATVSQYSLPAATASTLGGVKIGTNLSMDTNDVLSATDTTYSNFTGTDGTATGTAGLVPAPATTDAGKVLSASGSWTTPDAGIKTLTTADYNYPETGTKTAVAIHLLAAGVYQLGENNVTVRVGATNYVFAEDSMFYVLTDRNNYYKGVLYWGNTNDGVEMKLCTNTGSEYLITNPSAANILQGYHTEDDLVGTSIRRPLSANQGRVLKDLIDSIAIRGAGAPTTSTVGTVGQLYEDGTNGDLYQLKSIDITVTPNTYNWEEVGGGSGPAVVQTTGTSTADVMSQNAVTSMVFNDPSTKQRVQIGSGATVSGAEGVAIGRNAKATRNFSVAVGTGSNASGSGALAIGGASSGVTAEATAINSIAIGSGARATTQGEMNIGSSYDGYNNSAYRLLTGLYDPQSAHDAATKGYVDTKATITMTTTDPGEGASIGENQLIGVYS